MPDHSLPGALSQLSNAPNVHRVAQVLRGVARTLIGADGITFVLRDGDSCHYVEEDAMAPLWKGQRFAGSGCSIVAT